MDGGVKELYARESRFQKQFGKDAVEIDCHTGVLKGEIQRILRCKGICPDLEDMHKHITPAFKRYNMADGVNQVTAELYDTDAAFLRMYHKFIESIVPHFPFPFYFQKTPTIRIHCPDSENADHYPRYHSDIAYGHPPEEINLWIPLTVPLEPQCHGFRLFDVAESAQILGQFDYDLKQFIEHAVKDRHFICAPQVRTALGRMLAFDSRCLHTGEPLWNHTRVSMDIRILPVADYDAGNIYQGTGRMKMRYMPGEAYCHLASNELAQPSVAQTAA